MKDRWKWNQCLEEERGETTGHKGRTKRMTLSMMTKMVALC